MDKPREEYNCTACISLDVCRIHPTECNKNFATITCPRCDMHVRYPISACSRPIYCKSCTTELKRAGRLDFKHIAGKVACLDIYLQ